MKTPTTGLLALALTATVAFAQVDIPGMPGKFKSRSIGGGTSSGVAIIPKENPKVRYTTHIILSPARQWTSTDGKTLEGELIAFEDLVTEGIQGAAPPEPPAPPKYPTVVRNGKARLLINHKPFEVALERLSPPDREFIEQTRIAHQKKTPPK